MITMLGSTPFFGLTLSLLAYLTGAWIYKKTKSPFTTPLLIAYIIIWALLLVFDIPLSVYMTGGSIINMFLGPITVILAAAIYQQWELLKQYFPAVIGGALVGSAVALTTTYALGKLVGLDDMLIVSLLPKNVTTPIALELSDQLQGIPSLTVIGVIISGIFGNIFAPLLVKLFRIKNPIAAGVAIGTCSHALGTSKALEMGDVQGAMSSVSIGITGLLTILIVTVFF